MAWFFYLGLRVIKMKYARVLNQQAVDVRGTSPIDCFTEEVVAEFQEVPDDVVNGWVLDGAVWSAPVVYTPTAEELAVAAEYRAAEEAARLASTLASEDAAALELSKTIGIDILGVMCSATKTDQSGLTAVALGVTLARMANTTFPDTKFEFENGNSLVVTNANFDTIYAAWMPFRQSFFTP